MFEVKNIEKIHYIQHDGNFYRRRYVKIDDDIIWTKRVTIKRDHVGDVNKWVGVLNPNELESKFQDTEYANN